MENTKKLMLEEFRQSMQHILMPEHTDEFLRKWLKGRNYNLVKAKKMLTLQLRFRNCYQLDTIVTTYKKPEHLAKYEFTGFLGFDKEGSPVRYCCLGRGDVDGFLHTTHLFEVGKYCSYIIESDLKALREENNKTGRQAEGMTYIVDLEEFDIQHYLHRHVIETGFDLLKGFQDLYPDVVKRIICINAPLIFHTAFNIFKPAIKLYLLEKINVCSKATSDHELLKYIDADVLPKFIGGTRVDVNGDPYCSAFINFGGKIPKNYYGKHHHHIDLGEPGVRKTIIPARGSFDHISIVRRKGSTLTIEFHTDMNINLSIYYKPMEKSSNHDSQQENVKAELISMQAKLQSHFVPVNSSIYCDRPGKYILHFDNTFSWVNPKQLTYRIKVVPPLET